MKNKFVVIILILILVIGFYIFSKIKTNSILNCALDLYNNAKKTGINFSSQCLGTCGNYAVDIVHVPRTNEDNLIENQCKDYIDKKVNHFIEIDKDGNIVRKI